MSLVRWKDQERRVARLLNCRRNPNSGKGLPDGENEVIVFENKDMKDLPQWLVAEVTKARSKAGSRRLGALTITSRSTEDVYIVFHLHDFRDWYVGTPRKERRRL